MGWWLGWLGVVDGRRTHGNGSDVVELMERPGSLEYPLFKTIFKDRELEHWVVFCQLAKKREAGLPGGPRIISAMRNGQHCWALWATEPVN